MGCLGKSYEKVTTELVKIGRGERIRTSDPSVPNRVLYQAEPRPDRAKPYLTPPSPVLCSRI
jgi:hypothetical protein